MSHILRLFTIQRVLFRHRLDALIFASPLLRVLRWQLLLLPWNWHFRGTTDLPPLAVRFRCALEELGPIFVKCGQLLSTRRDLLPSEFSEEFSNLQNKVPPFPGVVACKIIERAYGQRLDSIFSHFDIAPLASASIAQVHAATLLDGRECIVKVIRPGIKELIRRDMSLIRFLARQLERYYPEGRSLHLIAVIQELEKTLLHELDIKREAANASQLRRNFRDEPRYHVPAVYWNLIRDKVLVMERVSGIPINDIAALQRAGVDLSWLAEFISQIFFTQVFRDNYFHADMHPGNVFVQPASAGQTSRVAVVDFGVMSSLTEFDKRYLAENFTAFLNHDYQRVAALHIESAWVPSGTRLDELEFAVRTVCEPLLDQPMSEISFGEVLRRLFTIAQSFNVEIMPQLILLQKTLLYVEGISRQLDPNMDIWQAAKPQLEYWMKRRTRLMDLLKQSLANFPHWGDRVPQLPTRLIDLLERFLDGKGEMVFKSDDMCGIRRELRIYYRRAICAIFGATLLISAAVLYGFPREGALMVEGTPFLASCAAILGGLCFLAAARSEKSG